LTAKRKKTEQKNWSNGGGSPGEINKKTSFRKIQEKGGERGVGERGKTIEKRERKVIRDRGGETEKKKSNHKRKKDG